ncbi:glycosyltransferase family 2 protein [Serratia fonticola]|uniref:glycosyltransferase family 2 protein n=1 Tax=Serratia fonticola TaxID=47917 RepID=UPI00217A3C52|nr:glycosyltransferase family 2 protein [Serratia fonticola]CAI0732882.1 Spore coat polysaccharide biosynthesis protein spsA [Serratia fonticola]CAI0734496.1 Spore coat polysaccharide biosynthesis protein spsA [Serratia fonticola]
MNMRELISVIMPTYNSEKTVAESINSIKAQTYENWELLITDDCSTDRTWDIISSYAAQDKRIKIYKNNENAGAGFSRNNSIANASGRFIAFLDSDDLWLPEKLSKQLRFMLNNNYHFVYSCYQKIDESGNKKGVISPPLYTNYNKTLYTNVIGCLTAMYDSHEIGKLYMPLIRRRQDLGLWLNIMNKKDGAYCYPEVLAYYRIGNSTLSSNKIKAIRYQWMFYREVARLSLLRSSICFVAYAASGFIKYIK